MNKEFTEILDQSLANDTLDTDTHLSIIKYLYPIIKSQYLNPAMSAEYIRYQKQAQIEFDEYVNDCNQSARINTEDDGRSQQSITTSISAAIDQQLLYQQQQQLLMQSREQINADTNGMMLNNANILAVNMNEEMKENLINYTLKIVQFTCANFAWYSSKWENISIKYKHHRMIGAFLCQQPSMNEENSSKDRSKIREIICKCLKRKQFGIPDINRMSDYCKILCLTLQHQNDGHWAVMIGHRTLFRSFYTCNMEYDYDGGYIDMDMIADDNVQQEILQQQPLTINLKTDANFIHLGFGFGVKCFNWSVIVVHLEGK